MTGVQTCALPISDQVLEKEPKNTLAHILKCNALYYDDKLQDAVRGLEELRNLVPKDSNMGRLLLAREIGRASCRERV